MTVLADAPDKKCGGKQRGTPSQAQVWGSVAQWASAIIAGVGLSLIYCQVDAIKQNALTAAASAKEQNARQVYTTYMNWGLHYPEFTAKPVPYESFKSDREKSLRYEWYVMNFLFAYDEIFVANKNDAEWNDTFLFDLPSHLTFICSYPNTTLLRQFYKTTQNKIFEAAHQAGIQTCGGHDTSAVAKIPR